MKAEMLVRYNSEIDKGDAPPEGQEARFVRAGLAEYVAEDDMKALRAEYKAKMGKQPYNGWDAKTLREKMG